MANSVMHPRSSSTGCNTNASVTGTVASQSSYCLFANQMVSFTECESSLSMNLHKDSVNQLVCAGVVQALRQLD